MRNNAAWRANVRKAYKDRTSNPQHRGAWGNEGVYVLFSGYAGSWRFFGPLGPVNLSITEGYNEVYTISSVSDRPGVDPVSLEDIYNAGLVFEAKVRRKDVVYKDYTVEPTAGAPPDVDTCVRTHGSATPYGEGLYDMAGSFMITGNKSTVVYQKRETSDGYEGTVEESERSTKIITYRTQAQLLDGVLQTPKINGMNTRIRITSPQEYHGPNYAQAPIDAPGPPISIEPFEKNPDGDDLGGLAIEFYFTDRAARALQSGRWGATMERVSGGGGDTYDVEDDDGYTRTTTYSNNFTRSGELILSTAG